MINFIPRPLLHLSLSTYCKLFMMVLAHGASVSEVHVRRFPSTVLLSRNHDPKFRAIP